MARILRSPAEHAGERQYEAFGIDGHHWHFVQRVAE